MQRPYQLTADGSTLVMRLNNKDRRFSPENEDSGNPLAGKIQPLRPVRVTSNDGRRSHALVRLGRIGASGRQQIRRAAGQDLCTGGLQFLSSTETKIELQENQRSDQIINALIQEVIFPAGAADAWVLGDPDYSKLASRPSWPIWKPSATTRGRADAEPGGDNWVRQGGYPTRRKTPSMSTAASATSRRPSGASSSSTARARRSSGTGITSWTMTWWTPASMTP